MGIPENFHPHSLLRILRNSLGLGELKTWTVGVRGRGNPGEKLGSAKWDIPGGTIWQISRTRIKNTDRLGVISDSRDEATGLSEEARVRMEQAIKTGAKSRKAARAERSKEEGLLLLYPISRYSGHDNEPEGNRTYLFENPEEPSACDLLGLAFSFPKSSHPQPVVEYVSGTVEGR